jgi:hypothetical protein
MATRYSYDRRAAESAPTYKGKALKPHGPDVWILEGHGAHIVANFKHGGWEAHLELPDEDLLKTKSTLPGTTHGKDLEAVIDNIIHNENSRIKGARHRLDEVEKAINSLKH